jgi:dCMP deaminase
MKRKFVEAHMKVAETYAQLSSAKRLKVGAVIVKNDTIIGIGYNGMPSGWTNECEEKKYTLTGSYEYLDEDGSSYNIVTKSEVIHAESNALCKVTKSTNSSENADMFVTHAPCIHCAKLIHQSGVRKVFYRDSYRNDEGLQFLYKCGVEIEKV